MLLYEKMYKNTAKKYNIIHLYCENRTESCRAFGARQIFGPGAKKKVHIKADDPISSVPCRSVTGLTPLPSQIRIERVSVTQRLREISLYK